MPLECRTYHSHAAYWGRMCLLVLGVLLCTRGHPQENPQRLDSILPLLDPAKKDTVQLSMLIWAAESWTTSPKAIPYLERLDGLSNELLDHADPRVQQKARHARGAFHFFTGYHAKFARNIPVALGAFQQAIRDFDAGGHRHAVGQCLDALGLVYELAGGPDKAERAFREELRIGRAIGHTQLQIQALVHLAHVHADRGEPEYAWHLLDSCGTGTPGDSSMILNERARIRQRQGRMQEAETFLRTSLSVAERSHNAWDQLPVLTPLARLLYDQDRNADGLATAQRCAALAEHMGDATAQCGCINLAGDGYARMGEWALAERSYTQGMQLAEAIGNIGVARELGDEGSMLYAANGLKEVLKRQGRHGEALVMTERWSLLKDSVDHMNGREELLLYRHREQEIIDSLEHAQAIRMEVVEHGRQLAEERTRRYVIIGICLASLALTLALWSRFRYIRRANAAILDAQQQLVASEKRREAEVVRTRIARDVHDQLGSDLTKLSMLGSEVRASLHDDPASVPALVADIDRISSEAGRSLSDIVWAVDPAHDSLHGLVEHARTYCQRMLHNSGIRHSIQCVAEGPDRTIHPATKRDIYLSLRETLNNAMKYAHAEQIDVKFMASPEQVEMDVRDDGKGFNTTNPSHRGNGLRNLKERADRSGGVLVITSEPGGGTAVRLVVRVEHVNL